MNLNEVNRAASDALLQLEEQYSAAMGTAGWGGFWVEDVAGMSDAVVQGLRIARQSIDFLAGELLDRVNNPGDFSGGLAGQAAWDAWVDLANETSSQLALIDSTAAKYSLGSTLRRSTIEFGRVVERTVSRAESALPWLAVALVAAAYLKGRR